MQINSSIKYILNTKISSWNQETALFYYKDDRTKEEFSEKNLEIENCNNYIIRNQYNNILQIKTNIDLIIMINLIFYSELEKVSKLIGMN